MLRRLFSVYHASIPKDVFKGNFKAKSWKIHSYGDITELQLDTQRLPVINNPNEVLVKVSAASLNPIDLFMLGGYGRTLFKILRQYELEFPLTLGRDFSGTVVAKGHGVGDTVNIGDEVYGFIPIHKQGSFSETILAEKDYLLPKPKHLDHVESASLVYAAMTAWSALFIFGNIAFRQSKGLRVLILGSSGGVGTAAVQLLKSQGCVVYGTCSADALPMVNSLGADKVFDYRDKDFERQVELEGRFHIILDGAKFGYQNIPKTWKYDSYITLNSPLLINTDNYGLFAGLIYSFNNILEANLNTIGNQSIVKWGFFVPSTKGFQFVHELISTKKIKPIIHKVFNFGELPEAFKTLSQGHLRGKIVVKYDE